jgi:hypothetical protein
MIIQTNFDKKQMDAALGLIEPLDYHINEKGIDVTGNTLCAIV